MKKQRQHRWSIPIRWAAALMAACLCNPDAAASSSPGKMDEVHHYQEVTGASAKKVAWALNKGDRFTLTYTSPDERHTTTTGHDYDTLRWQVDAEKGRTRFTAERMGQTIRVRGMYKGEPVDKQLRIDDGPWYQATSLSLRGMVAAGDSERTFWTIRPGTLTAHKIRAIKKEVETVQTDAGPQKLLRIRLTLPGLLAPFWKSDYWFTLAEGIFFRFEGPSGPPGSPMTVVKRTAD